MEEVDNDRGVLAIKPFQILLTCKIYIDLLEHKNKLKGLFRS
jgi:hypothetical protein